MYLLIDTSSAHTLVSYDGRIKIAGEINQQANGSHNETLVKLVDQITGNDLSKVSKIILGIGPGSFTGIRIALSFSCGLSAALNVPIQVASSFLIWAWVYKNHLRQSDKKIVVYSDARREELFVGYFKYEKEKILVIEKEKILAKTKFEADKEQDWEYLCLDALSADLNLNDVKVEFDFCDQEAKVFAPGEVFQIVPNYLREVSARTIAERNNIMSK